jgi:plastocyanin
MKPSLSLITLLALASNCGGNAAPAASPPEKADSDHSMSAPVLSAHVEPTVAPAASSPVAVAAPGATGEPAKQTEAAAPTLAAGTLTVTVTSTPVNAAKQAVVYIEDAPKDRDVGGTMDNRQMAFVPHVLVITAGAKVTFRNSDPFPHNVFSPDNEKWDMGIIPANGTKLRKFEKPGFYTVLCNMHPNMKAYIAVLPSSYFAKADKSGEIAVKDIPAGKHDVVIWAPGVKVEHREVVIDGDKTLAVELHR